jgi:hypothetical protein
VILIVTPDRNTPGKSDYSGAFRPEARAFARAHVTSDTLAIDISKPMAARRAQLLERVDSLQRGDLEAVAFFCHGLTRKLPQLGWDTRNVGELAQAIAERAAPVRPRVVLYACSAANDIGLGGDGGFADTLRDELCAAGAVWCQVDAHVGAGHTTMNPRVRRFEGRGSLAGGAGGAYLVPPESRRYKRWRQLLRTEYRFEFPFRSATEIAERLEG